MNGLPWWAWLLNDAFVITCSWLLTLMFFRVTLRRRR